jgi:general secretion pathway protein B
MSILLEALKKSEQQRQLGQTPTLQTGIEGLPSQVTLNHWIPLSLLALSACVMIWFGWLQFRQPEPGYVPEGEAAVVQTREETQARTPTEKFKADGKKEIALVAHARVAVEEDDSEKARLNKSFNEFTAEIPAADTAVQAGDSAAAEELPSQAAAGPEVVKAVSGRPGSEPGASMSEPGESRLQPHISEPISYWELPQGVRDNLPEIKITVLVYAEEPDDRFVLTNGQRLAEKDELQSGLVLDEIRRDGAIFLYRKYRFLVKG